MTSSDDDIAVRNLLARVARLADVGTVDQFLELFTQDAVFEIPGRPPSNGRTELRERTEAQRQAGVVGPSSPWMHLLGTSDVQVEADGAEAFTPWIVCAATSQPAISLAGRYHDTLVRTSDGWRIRHRRLQFG